jgi:hypothetical protein
VPSAAIKSEWLNGWVNTSSITSTSTGGSFGRLMRLIEVRM